MEEEQVLGLILTKMRDFGRSGGGGGGGAGFPLDLVVLKMLVDMEIVVKERTYLTKALEKEKQVTDGTFDAGGNGGDGGNHGEGGGKAGNGGNGGDRNDASKMVPLEVLTEVHRSRRK